MDERDVMTTLRLREAVPSDAAQVARLHADSWRRHYRGAFADSYLDGDILTDRETVWSTQLDAPDGSATIVAEDDGELVGFVHTIFDDDDRWGSLVDNLHVVSGRQRSGIGSALLTRAADVVTRHAAHRGIYLWVLEQNTRAQSFYAALGGVCVERAPVPDPGGVPGRLKGRPYGLLISWADASTLRRG